MRHNLKDEILEIVNVRGDIIETAQRNVLHNNNSLLHRVVHLLLFNGAGQLLLQKRSMTKDLEPGKWDTSVGGHIALGETIDRALEREIAEELRITECRKEFLYSYVHSNARESELVYAFRCVYEGEIRHNPHEISEVKFWDIRTVEDQINSDIFSTNFKDEFRRYKAFSML